MLKAALAFEDRRAFSRCELPVPWHNWNPGYSRHRSVWPGLHELPADVDTNLAYVQSSYDKGSTRMVQRHHLFFGKWLGLEHVEYLSNFPASQSKESEDIGKFYLMCT